VRRREIALRAALGAHRARVARQLLAENLVVVLAAGAIGLGLAVLGTETLSQLAPLSLLRSGAIRISGAALAFVVLVSLTVALVLGLIPVMSLARVDLGAALRTAAGDPALPGRRVTLPDLLVIGQVAVALFLLVGGGLLARSLERAQSVELGFSTGGVVSMTISLPEVRYPGAGQKVGFFQDLVERVRSLPGIRSVGLASHLPLGAGPLMGDFTPADRFAAAPGETPRAQLIAVTHGYFGTLGLRLLAGRLFVDADRAGAPPVVVVDATLARRMWPGADPIGKRIRIGAALGADTALREVVGVVNGTRLLSLELEPAPAIYLPHAQTPWPTMNLVIRAHTSAVGLADLVTAEVRALDAGQPVYNVRSLEQVVDRALAYRRFQTMLLGGFALAALLLSVIGVYGVLAFGVAQRTRELGIRVALGATRRDILTSILRQASTLLGAGLLLGGVAAAAAGRLLGGVLYQVGPTDPLTFAGATVLLLTAGLIAGYLPARRAMGVDPVEVLRREG
jgi:putative ABC transport system permease protein